MRCRDANARLFAAADGTLSIEERFELDAHVAECARCAARAEELARLDEALVRVARVPLEHLDVEHEVRTIRARIEAGVAPTRSSARPRRIAMLVAAAAAMVAAAAWIAHELRARPSTSARVVEGETPRRELAPDARLESDSSDRDATETPATKDRDARTEHDALAGDLHRAEPSSAIPLDAPSDLAVASAAPTHAVPPAPTEEERARLAAAKETLARALALVVESAPRAPRDELDRAFAAATRDLAREGWPLARLAEGMLDSADVAVARGAARFLGVRGAPSISGAPGDRSSARALQSALERADVSRDAALALADLGEAGVDALATLDDRREPARTLVELAVDRVASRGDASAVRDLERLVRLRARDRDRAVPATLLAALARSGVDATAALARLASDGVVPATDATALLRTAPNATAELDRLLAPSSPPSSASDARGLDERVLLLAIDALRPESGVAWLEERARTVRELRAPAMQALAGYADARAAAALVRLARSGRVDPELACDALRDLAAGNPDATAELARDAVRARDRATAQAVYDVATTPPSPAFVAALVELASEDVLTRDARKSALLTAGEIGSPDDAERIAIAFARLPSVERELRAACVLAIHRLRGRAGVQALALAKGTPSNERALARLLALLDDASAASRPTTTLFRVAQELDALAPRNVP